MNVRPATPTTTIPNLLIMIISNVSVKPELGVHSNVVAEPNMYDNVKERMPMFVWLCKKVGDYWAFYTQFAINLLYM